MHEIYWLYIDLFDAVKITGPISPKSFSAALQSHVTHLIRRGRNSTFKLGLNSYHERYFAFDLQYTWHFFHDEDCVNLDRIF